MGRMGKAQRDDYVRGSHAMHAADGFQGNAVTNEGNVKRRSGKPQHGSKKSKGWSVVFYVALVVAIAALLCLGVIVFQYAKGRMANDRFAETAGVARDTAVVNLADLRVDWEALRAVNPDIVAWVYIPNSPVNYPVVQTTNNDKYLRTDFEGNESWGVSFGTIFLDYRNANTFFDQNNFIYGHHMNDGSMFAFVNDLLEADKFNANRTVYLLTPAGNYRLTSFSVLHVNASERIVQTQFASAEDAARYVQDAIDRTEVRPNTEIPKAENMGKTFMFSTCDNDLATDGRVILCCYIAESTVPGVQPGVLGDVVKPAEDEEEESESDSEGGETEEYSEADESEDE